MVTVILLTNLLVSIFGKTYDTDLLKTRQLWQLQRYKVRKHFTVPTCLNFSIVSIIYVAFGLVRVAVTMFFFIFISTPTILLLYCILITHIHTQGVKVRAITPVNIFSW